MRIWTCKTRQKPRKAFPPARKGIFFFRHRKKNQERCHRFDAVDADQGAKPPGPRTGRTFPVSRKISNPGPPCGPGSPRGLAGFCGQQKPEGFSVAKANNTRRCDSASDIRKQRFCKLRSIAKSLQGGRCKAEGCSPPWWNAKPDNAADAVLQTEFCGFVFLWNRAEHG